MPGHVYQGRRRRTVPQALLAMAGDTTGFCVKNFAGSDGRFSSCRWSSKIHNADGPLFVIGKTRGKRLDILYGRPSIRVIQQPFPRGHRRSMDAQRHDPKQIIIRRQLAESCRAELVVCGGKIARRWKQERAADTVTVTALAMARGAVLRVNLFAVREQSLRIHRLRRHRKIRKGRRRLIGGCRCRVLRRIVACSNATLIALQAFFSASGQKCQRHRRKQRCNAGRSVIIRLCSTLHILHSTPQSMARPWIRRIDPNQGIRF